MDTFHVWLSPLGATCKVRVDGIENANWLLTRLRQSLIFESPEPVNGEKGSSCCTFGVACRTQVCYRTFEKLLAAIPEVELILDPARAEGSKNEVTAPTKAKSKSPSKVKRTFKPSPSTTISIFPKWIFSTFSRAVVSILQIGS